MATHGGLDPSFNVERLGEILTSDVAAMPAIQDRLATISGAMKTYSNERQQSTSTTNGDDGVVTSRRARKAMDFKNLNRLLEEEDRQVDHLRSILRSTGERLAVATEQSSAVERRLRQVQQREGTISAARKRAESEAARATAEARAYRLHLDLANRENAKAQEAVNTLLAERQEAEEAAARARTKARKLQEKLIWERARQLGRKEGLEEGLHQGYDEGLDQGRQEGHGEGYEEARARAFRVFEQALKDGAILENGDFDLDTAIKVERSKMLALPPPRSQAPSRRSSLRAGIRQTSHRETARSITSSRRAGVDGAVPESKDPLPPPNIQVTVTSPPDISRPQSFRSPSPHPSVEPFPDGYVPTVDASGHIVLPPPHEINPSPSLRPSPLPSNAPLPGSSYAHSDAPRSPRSSRRPSVSATEGVPLEEAARLRREKDNAEREAALLAEELLRERELREKEEAERARERAAEQKLQQEREQERQAEREREAKLARELEVERELRELEERERLERERLERERLERERSEQERFEQERLEQEHIERERIEKERLEQERLEKERLEQERLERERLEKERLEQERLAMERLERERIERERIEEERIERERVERERLEQERVEQERLERARVERELELELERQWEHERLEKEREEARRQKEQRERELKLERVKAQEAAAVHQRPTSRDISRDELDEDGESEDEDEVTTDEPVNLPYPTAQHRPRTVPPRKRNAKSRSVASHKTGQTYRTAGAASTPLSSFSVLVPESDMEDRRRRIASENEKTLQAVRHREREELDAAHRAPTDPHADPPSRPPFNGGILPVIREQSSTSELNGHSGREHSTPHQSQQQAPRTPHPANPILPIRLDRGPPDHITNGIGMPTPGSTHHNLPKSPSGFSKAQILPDDDSNDSEQTLRAKGQRVEQLLSHSQSQWSQDRGKPPKPRPRTTIPEPLANSMPQTNNPWNTTQPTNLNYGPGFPTRSTQPGGSPALPPLPHMPPSPRQDSYASINMTPRNRSTYDRIANLQASNGMFEPILPGSPATSVREGKPVDIPTIHVEKPSRESSESSQMNAEGHLLTPEAAKRIVELPHQPSQPVSQPGRPRPILKQSRPSNTSKTQDGPLPTYNGQPVPSLSNGTHPVGPGHTTSDVRTGARPSAPPSPLRRAHSPRPASSEAEGIIPDVPNQDNNAIPGSPASSVANPVTADMLPEAVVTKRMARPGAYHPPEPSDQSRLHGSPLRTVRNSWMTPGPTIEPDLPTPSPNQMPGIQVEPAPHAASKSPFITPVPLGQPTPHMNPGVPFAQVTNQNMHHNAMNGLNPQTIPTPRQRMARPLGSRIEDIGDPVFTAQSPQPPVVPFTPRMSRPMGSMPIEVKDVTVGATPYPGTLPPMTPKMARPLASRHEDFGGPTDANASPVIPPQTPGRMLRPGMRPPSPVLNRFGGPPPVVDLVVPGYGYPNASRSGPAFRTPALPSMTPKQAHGQIGPGGFPNGFPGGFGGRGGGLPRPGNFSRRPVDDSALGGPGMGPGPRPLANYPNASRTGPAFRNPGLPPTTPRHIPQPIIQNGNGFGNGFSRPNTWKIKPGPESSPSPVIPDISLTGPSPSPSPAPPGFDPSPAPVVQPAFGDGPIQMAFEASPQPTWRPLSRATSIKSTKTMPRKASVTTVSDEGSDAGVGQMFDNGW